MRYWVVSILDWLDEAVLRHRLYNLGLCTWLAEHPWWETGPALWRDGVAYYPRAWTRRQHEGQG